MENKDSLLLVSLAKELIFIFGNQSNDRKIISSKIILRTEFERLLRPFASNLGVELYEAAVLLVVIIERKVCSSAPRQVGDFFGENSINAIETELEIIKSAKTGSLAKYLDVDEQTARNCFCYTLKADSLSGVYEALNSL